MNKYLLTTLLSLFVCACTPNYYKEALELAGSNRAEIEKVVAHYQNTGEKLKVKAARFLISNMEEKSTVFYPDSVQKSQMIHDLNSLINADLPRLQSRVCNYIDHNPLEYYFVSDLQTLSSSYLISQIDEAFEVWEQTGWHSQYSFDDFCEYVLPYKLDIRPIEDWRTEANAGKDALDDSLQQIENPMLLARKLLHDSHFEYCVEMDFVPYPFGFHEMRQLPYGTCIHMGDYAIYSLRSRGIPASKDYAITWANRSASHSWPVTILPNGRFKTLSYYMDDFDVRSERDYEQVVHFKAPKIYRDAFVIQRNAPAYKYRHSEPVLSTFVTCMDATKEYDMPQFTASLNINLPLPNHLVFLSTFNNVSWVPVACTERKGNKATFEHMGVGIPPKKMDFSYTKFMGEGAGIAYLPMQYSGNELISVAAPFILDTLGRQHHLEPDLSHKQSLTITRKYPEQESMWETRTLLPNLKIWASSDADGTQKELILSPNHMLDSLYQPFAVNTSRATRYVTLTADTLSIVANIEVTIAEAIFYDKDGNRLNAECVNGTGSECLDGDILTYFSLSKSDSVCLDFGRPVVIDHVELATRNDDNEIVPGFTYELVYWDKQWVTLGTQKAKAHFLKYDNLPTNALFRLICRSGGKEERIFTIQDGEPVWW